MVRTGLITKIMHCLTSDDDDVRYWAVLCIHESAGQGNVPTSLVFRKPTTTHRFLLMLTPAALVEAHPDILSATEFPIMLELGSSNKSQATAYVADILSLICCLSKSMRYQSDANTITVSNMILIDSNNNNLATHSEAIVATLNSLLMWEEPEIQYNAAGALFNMMAMSGKFERVNYCN